MVLISPVIETTVETVNPIFGSSLRAITVPFTIPVGPGQKIQFARVFAQVTPLDNPQPGRASIVQFNNRNIGDRIWDQFETGTLEIDKEVNVAGIKPNEENEITILIEQKFSILGSVRWRLFADFFYTLVNETTGQEEIPPEAPMLGEPEDIIADQPSEDDGIFGFNLTDFLFGDTDKIVRTVAIAAGVVAAVLVIPPVARAITATQKVRRKTAV